MTIVALDLETTGLDLRRHYIWEIGAIVRGHRDPAFDGQWHIMVRPNLDTADPRALQIGRYYERSGPIRDVTVQAHVLFWPLPGVAGGYGDVSRKWVARTLAELLDGAHLVGMNPRFDAEFLDRFLRDNWQAPCWDYHLVDVRPLALGYAAAMRYALDQPAPDVSSSCGDLAAQLGVPPVGPDQRHTAIGDARYALAIYDKVMRQ